MCCEGQGKQFDQMGQSCCRGHHGGHGHGSFHGGFGGFHGMHGHMHRHFITDAEKIKHLEKYRESLENEIKGIDEHIKKMKS